MLVDDGLELLDEEDCWTLLRSGEVGRVGVTMGAMPAIFPVNYAVVDDAIVFRTAPGTKLRAATEGAVVAFEVDDYDRSDRSGWSVLAVGASQVIDDRSVGFEHLAAHLESFADGARGVIVRIHPGFISGRRLVHEAPPRPGL
jgi:nitroimidazol reductase NimA-like FMN-containing flavoprotein (pyridoxamine 5'-phosphate oxidase superfamily)